MPVHVHRNAAMRMPPRKKTVKPAPVQNSQVIGGAMDTARNIAGDQGVIKVISVARVSVLDLRGYGPGRISTGRTAKVRVS